MGRSLNSTPSVFLYQTLRHKHFQYQLTAEAKGKPKMSFKQFCYNNNFDLSGRTKVNNPFL